MAKKTNKIIVPNEPEEVTEIRNKILEEFKDLKFEEGPHKYYIGEKEFTKEEFYSLLSIKNSDKLEISNIEKTSSGRIKNLKINGVVFSGRDIRTKLGLRSTFFTFYEEKDKIIVKTKGYGHGVGMSQYGANGMAISGFSYQDILKYYYTDVEIKKI